MVAHPPMPKTAMTSSRFSFLRFFSLLGLICWSMFGCSNPQEGTYCGNVGSKKNVSLSISANGTVELNGYWSETLVGRHERASLKGENVDAFVFDGPANKKFKLRILHRKSDDYLSILAIQSRSYGPGTRYAPTEEDSVFEPPPRLVRRAEGSD